MGSIVLEPGVKEMLLSDTRDFLKSEKVRFFFFRGARFGFGFGSCGDLHWVA
jgi:chaperone BCS1